MLIQLEAKLPVLDSAHTTCLLVAPAASTGPRHCTASPAQSDEETPALLNMAGIWLFPHLTQQLVQSYAEGVWMQQKQKEACCVYTDKQQHCKLDLSLSQQ